ncbi:MAG: hypothetical protein PHY93_20365 [Bacteriovorax sp.]|nr:hypothetical protein [Bacteriovorax sp.]
MKFKNLLLSLAIGSACLTAVPTFAASDSMGTEILKGIAMAPVIIPVAIVVGISDAIKNKKINDKSREIRHKLKRFQQDQFLTLKLEAQNFIKGGHLTPRLEQACDVIRNESLAFRVIGDRRDLDFSRNTDLEIAQYLVEVPDYNQAYIMGAILLKTDSVQLAYVISVFSSWEGLTNGTLFGLSIRRLKEKDSESNR